MTKKLTVKLGDAQAAYRELTNTVKAKGGTIQVVMSFDDVKWKRNAILLNRNEWVRPRKAPKLIGEVREIGSAATAACGKATRLAMSPSYAAGVLGLSPCGTSSGVKRPTPSCSQERPYTQARVQAGLPRFLKR